MRSKHLLLMLLLALMAPWAVAQNRTLVTIGDGTSTQKYPLPGYYGYQYDVFIYTPTAAPALDVDSDISSIAFYVSTNNTSGESSMEIWVKDVDANYTLAKATTFSDYIDGATKVYENDDLTTTTEWNTFEFSDDFSHEGGKALLVAVRGVGCGTSACSRECRYTNASNTYWYKHQDGTDPGTNVSGTLSQYRANIQLNLTYTGAVCFAPSDLAASNITDNSATLGWTENGEGTAWVLQYGTDNTFATNTTEVNVSDTPTKGITSLMATTTYFARVKPSCDTDDSHWSETATFTTTAVATAVGDSWSDDFEGTSCDWQLINGEITNAWAHGIAAHTGTGSTKALYISNDGGTTNAYTINSPAMVFATKLLGFTEGKFEFSYNWIANGEGSSDYLRVALAPASVTLTAGTSTPSGFGSTALPTGWIALDGGSKLNLVSEWQSKTVAVNVPAGNYYLVLAWRNDGSLGTQPPAAVDNVSITRVTCPYDVTGLEVEDDPAPTAHEATINWTAGDASQWQVAWSKDNTFAPANTQTQIVNTNTINLENLDATSTYYVKVRAYCGGTDYGQWCNAISFDTECEAITVTATSLYNENFNSYSGCATSSTPLSTYPNDKLPRCWSFLNRSQSSDTYPQVFLSSYSDYAVSGNCLFLKSSSTTPLYAILPEFTNNISDLMLTFTYRNEGTNSSNGTLYVSYMTDPADASTFNEENAVACERTTSKTEKEVLFANAPAGSYIAFKYQGGSSNNYYLSIDNVIVELTPTCIKPSSLMLNTPSARTAHTATLKWTNGEEGQTAWQIAYSTETDFDPNTVTPVDVTTNPATITGLAANTDYYAYVRANCGSADGMSAWCTNKTHFKTTVGNAAPTGLACPSATLESSTAVINWTGVATNDNHESFDLYYALATVTEVPAEPTTPNFIAGITSNTNTLTGLNPETEYKVWVRDNCGTDGISEWTSPITFTTLAACPPPTGLVASEITNHTAKLAWTGTSESYNVSYRTKAYIDGTVEEFNSSSTPTNWTRYTGLVDNVIAGTATLQTTTNGWYASSSALGFYNMCLNIYGLSRNHWLVTPEITLKTGDALSFDLALTNSSGTGAASGTCVDDRFIVLVYADEEWHILREWNNEDGTQYVYNNIATAGQTVSDINITGYIGNTVKFAFYGESTASNGDNYMHIDNVAIGTPVTAGDWVTIDPAPEASPVTLTNLAAETKYEAKVQGNCGDEGMSTEVGPITFTTAIACPAPTGLSVSNLKSASVDLSWTNGGSEYWRVGYKKASDPTFTVVNVAPTQVTIEGTTVSYTLTGLDESTDYIVKVQDNCEATVTGDGQSDWTDEVNFTTTAQCALDNVTVSNITHHAATVNWDGESEDHFSVYVGQYAAAQTYIEKDFEDETIPDDWTNNSTHPWTVVEGNNGHCIKSGNAGVASSTSEISFSYTFTEAGRIEFDALCQGEGTSTIYDHCDFYIDSDRKLYAGEQIPGWNHYGFNVAAGTHTFKWSYTKDSSVDKEGDAFSVDNIVVMKPSETWGTPIVVNENEYAISGLTAGTEYLVKVVPNCDEILASEIQQFTTVSPNQKWFITEGNWGTAANWEPEGAPTIEQDVVLKANATITIESGVAYAKRIAGTGTGTDAKTLTIENGAKLKHLNSNVRATVKKTITGYTNYEGEGNGGYYLIPNPTTSSYTPNSEGNDGILAGNYDLYSFDYTQADEWRNFKVTPKPFSSLSSGLYGYLYANQAGTTLSFTGTINPYTSYMSRSLTASSSTTQDFPGWYLLGNPYMYDAYLANGSSSTATGLPYVKMNAAGDGFENVPAGTPIEPMTGFFYQATSSGSVYVVTTAPAVTDAGLLNMNLRSGNKQLDNAIVAFGSEQKLEKFSFRANSSKIYMPVEGKDYAITNAEPQGEMPVSFKAENNGSYTLSFNTENVEFGYLHLIDNMTGMDVDLLQNPSYSFEAKTTDYASRFKLVFSTGNGVNEESFAFISDGNIILNGEGMLQVVDVMGRIMMQEENATSVSTSGMTPGVYVLRLINGDSVRTQKIVIK